MVTHLANIALICDTLPLAIIAFNSDYRIIAFNKDAEALLGISRSAMLDKDLRSFVAEAPLSQIILGQIQEHGDIADSIDFNFNGHPFRLVFSDNPLFVHDNRITGALAIIKDQLEPGETGFRRRHLEALAGIGEMAAVTIHEIRNPLTAISGFVQLLQSRATQQKEQTAEKYCRLISDEIVHINNILSDFLTLAKPQENKMRKLDVVQLANETIVLMQGEALLFQISLIQNLPNKPLYLIGNADKIKEVLINICRNAFQSMSAGGTLTIAIKEDGEYLRIDLTDTGHGMSDAIIANIYNPFFTTKETGTGLGLAICQRIVQDHNGEIKVASELGKGTTFTLRLPFIKNGKLTNAKPYFLGGKENALTAAAQSQHISL